jgi:hypothetical protein
LTTAEARLELGPGSVGRIYCGFGVYAPLYCEPSADKHAVAAICRDALELIDRAGLLWLCTLGIGGISAFVWNRRCIPRGLVVVDPEGRDVLSFARVLVRAAGGTFASLWLDAEVMVRQTAGGVGPSELDGRFRFVQETFGNYMVDAFDLRNAIRPISRLACGRTTVNAQFQKLDMELAQFPLTKHLLSYWCPDATQDAFLKGSPFDTAPTLVSLYGI